MKRSALLGAVGIAALAAAAGAQLVPLAHCHAAIPCSIPYGLRPADAVANLPDAGFGNTAIVAGVGLDNGLKLRLVTTPYSRDPVENAARLYVRKNPLKGAATPTPAPTPPPHPKTPA